MLLADGSEVPIALMKVGMMVKTMNADGLFVDRPVIKVFRHKGKFTVIPVKNGDRTLFLTKDHKIWSGWAKGMAAAGELAKQLEAFGLTKDNTNFQYEFPSEECQLEEVFNLSVGEHHNYFAEGMLISNMKKEDIGWY